MHENNNTNFTTKGYKIFEIRQFFQRFCFIQKGNDPERLFFIVFSKTYLFIYLPRSSDPIIFCKKNYISPGTDILGCHLSASNLVQTSRNQKIKKK